jgi:D-apiose dehydrogenase
MLSTRPSDSPRQGGGPSGPLQGAIIGCGYFAQHHLEAWNSAAGAALVAVCDLDPARAQAAAELTGAKAYTDAARMFAENRLDFVDIATAMGAHKALVELAAAHGVAMLVQKPIAPDWDQAVAMVDAAKAAGRPLMIHENFRFQPAMRRAGAIVRSGDIGAVTWVQVSFRSDFDFYQNQPYLRAQKDLILLEVGVHMTDMARYFAGEVETIYGVQQQLGPGIAGEDQATLLARHADGAVSVIDMSFLSHRPRTPYVEITAIVEATEGGLIVDGNGRLTVRTREETRVEDLPHTSIRDSIAAVFEQFLDCVRSGAEPETSGRDNLHSFALVLAGYESMRQGRPVAPRRYTVE